MATATQPGHMSLDLYLKSSFEPDAEYVDGVIEERPAGQYEPFFVASGDPRVVCRAYKRVSDGRSRPAR